MKKGARKWKYALSRKPRKMLLHLFSKRCNKKTKGGEFSAIPLLFAQPSAANATSLGEYYHPFKRLKAPP